MGIVGWQANMDRQSRGVTMPPYHKYFYCTFF
uniref:Uncharacterized protein n=1 Tax=Solanum lycopersicum TaxID=4081 RepID=A0A3Q7H695_SOLLC